MALFVEIVKEVAKGVAGELVTDVSKESFSNVGNAVKNALTDTVESVVAGRRSLEEWCEITSKPIDSVIAKTVSEKGVRFAGGYLSFSFADSSKNKIIIAYELFFVDENKKWIKQKAHSDVFSSNFKQEALNEISSKGPVKFDVEE